MSQITPGDVDGLTEIFRVLGDPTRVRILDALATAELCVGDLADDRLLHILRHARGRYGTTLDYLTRAVTCLREHGIHDRALERQLALARAHGL